MTRRRPWALAAAAVTVSALLSSPVAAQETDAGAIDGSRAWIAYNGGVGDGSGIRLVRTDGTEDLGLFEGQLSGEAWHPDWSPDGLRLAFAVDEADGTRDLWVGTADGSAVERVFDCVAPCVWTDDPAWSPDGGSVLFQKGAGVGDEELGVGTLELLDLETREARTLVTAAPSEYLYVPRWASDGHSIVVEVDRFASARLDESEVLGTTIAVVDLALGEPALRPIIANDLRAVYPDWSPDGEQIVFQAPVDPAMPDGPSDLFIVPASGDEPVAVTSIGAGGRQALQPSWTPDGRVVFVEQDGPFENVRMAVIESNGTGLASATGSTDVFGTHPRLQPGG